MKIRIEQRGGITGAHAVGEREVSALTPAQRRALDRLLNSAPRSPGPDRIHPLRYKLTVTEDDGSTRELDVPEDAMPDELASIPKVQL